MVVDHEIQNGIQEFYDLREGESEAKMVEKSTEQYIQICSQKEGFANEYIRTENVDCKACEEDSCTFVTPSYYCNLAMIEIDERLPLKLNKLTKPVKSIEQFLDEAGF